MAQDMQAPRLKLQEYPIAPDAEMTARIALGRGIFDRTSFNRFVHHATSTDIAVDVGAHVGSWSIGFSRIFDRVVSFEPHPVNRGFLETNLVRAHADNVVVHSEAVMDRKGMLSQEFCISALSESRNSGMPHLVAADKAGTNDTPVVCIDLDTALADLNPENGRIGALKIDIEGGELSAIKGAERVIREHQPAILLEINRHAQRYGSSQQEIYRHMAGLDYIATSVWRNDHVFVPIGY